MGLPRKYNTWRKRGGVWKRLVHSWLPRLSRNLGAATGAVTLRYGWLLSLLDLLQQSARIVLRTTTNLFDQEDRYGVSLKKKFRA